MESSIRGTGSPASRRTAAMASRTSGALSTRENITRNAQGGVRENSLMQYKIPTRIDYGHLNVEFESSYEPSGPFGAKSIGEIVINTPLPAIADAVYNAVGKRFYELPITPEQIARAAAEKLGEDFI